MRLKKDDVVAVLSQNQLQKLREGINNIRDLCLIFTGIEAGCRVGEMPYFRRGDIDWTERTIKKYDIKKKEWKVVGISPWLAQQLQLYFNAFKIKDKMFDLSPKRCDQILKHWCEKTGVQGWVSWHLLRRTFINQAARVGVDMKDVQHVTGDRLSTIEKYYRKANPSDTGKQIAKFYDEVK